MTLFILGLVLFLGMHSARVFVPSVRSQFIASKGAKSWQGLYTAVSLLGLGLLIWGYGIARQTPIVLWLAPVWVKHLAALLTLIAFIFITAANVPGNHIKAAVGHPMVLGVKIWAFAHLLANGRLPALVLFVAFLVWAIVLFAVSRRSDRVAGVSYAKGQTPKTIITVLVGTALWALFAFKLHTWLIGVSPLAMA
jgi:uncharacterized membrane protein